MFIRISQTDLIQHFNTTNPSTSGFPQCLTPNHQSFTRGPLRYCREDLSMSVVEHGGGHLEDHGPGKSPAIGGTGPQDHVASHSGHVFSLRPCARLQRDQRGQLIGPGQSASGFERCAMAADSRWTTSNQAYGSFWKAVPLEPKVLASESVTGRAEAEAAERHRQMMQRLQRRGLRERPVEGDGNCQFRALADQLYASQE
eukprot:s48_g6.t1